MKMSKFMCHVPYWIVELHEIMDVKFYCTSLVIDSDYHFEADVRHTSL